MTDLIKNDCPQVTIGLPVRNGSPLVRVAIDSLLSQTFRDFVLVISDNESNDDTGDICRAYAAADSRVRYIRQLVNLGNPGNFRFTLQQATTPFFMWAAHDDRWAPTFIERNLAALAANPQAVASVSNVVKILPDGRRELATGGHPISGPLPERLEFYFRTIGNLSRFYALFRTPSIQDSFFADMEFFGFDWAVMALNLLHGEHVRVDEILLERRAHPEGHYFRTLLKYESDIIDRWVPYRRLTLSLRKRLPPREWRKCRQTIFYLNLVQITQLAKFTMPFLTPMINGTARMKHSIRANGADQKPVGVVIRQWERK